MRHFEYGNALITWEESYDASNKVLSEKIHEVKIFYKTSYLITWRTSHCISNVLKKNLRIGKLIA